jgi:hypothetical protein
MVHRRKALIIALLPCLILLGLTVIGHSQPKSDSPQTPEVQQSPPAEKPYPTSPRKLGAGLQVIADLSVSPLTYTGPCPAVFNFKGLINVNKPTTVSYKFVRSDGVHTEANTLTFEKPGRQEVTTTWQFGDGTAPATFSGAVFMEVVYPVNVKIRSNAAYFKGSCTGPQGSPAK